MTEKSMYIDFPTAIGTGLLIADNRKKFLPWIKNIHFWIRNFFPYLITQIFTKPKSKNSSPFVNAIRQCIGQMALFQGDATHFRKCKASTTPARSTFPHVLHFDLTGLRRY